MELGSFVGQKRSLFKRFCWCLSCSFQVHNPREFHFSEPFHRGDFRRLWGKPTPWPKCAHSTACRSCNLYIPNPSDSNVRCKIIFVRAPWLFQNALGDFFFTFSWCSLWCGVGDRRICRSVAGGGVSLRVLLVGRDCGCVGQCGCRVSPKKGCKIKQRKNNWYLSMLFGVYAGLLFLLAISGRGSEPMEVGLWAKPFIFIIKGLWQNTEVSRTSFLEVITKCLENWERSQGSEWSCLSCGLLPALQDLFSFFFFKSRSTYGTYGFDSTL